MKKLVLLVCAILIGVGAAVLTLRARPKHVALRPSDPHRSALEYSMAPLDALYRAPEGKTPCESAYNAYKAEQDTSLKHGVQSHFTKLADRATFLARCQKLPAAAQPCMVPRYNADHEEECRKLRPDDDALKGIIEIRPQDPIEIPASKMQ